jgi:hypothetical protein
MRTFAMKRGGWTQRQGAQDDVRRVQLPEHVTQESDGNKQRIKRAILSVVVHGCKTGATTEGKETDGDVCECRALRGACGRGKGELTA